MGVLRALEISYGCLRVLLAIGFRLIPGNSKSYAGIEEITDDIGISVTEV
jgi:hypothetical protein